MEKVLAMHVAAQLTMAATSNVGGGNLPIDPKLEDQNVRAKNLHVWETFRVFYRGLVGALADTQSWPAPTFQAGNFLPALLQSTLPLLQSVAPKVMEGPLGEMIKKLIAALPAQPQLPPNLPDPGLTEQPK